MNNSYSVFMALMDYLPVFCFIIGVYFLSKIFFFNHQPNFGWMVVIGGALIFWGGGLQATWKLFKALDIGDYQWMSQGQFVFMALGYTFLFISVFSFLKSNNSSNNISFTAMLIWKIPFLVIMTLASLGTYGVLAHIAFRQRKVFSAISFLIAFIGVILLGSMANQQQTIFMQWIEQSVNSLANFGFAIGSYQLFRDFYFKKNFKANY